MLEARKAESFAYPEEMAGKPYLVNYTPLIFLKYDGMIGNAKSISGGM